MRLSETDCTREKEEEKIYMSGHSKFANIKHKKEKNDAAKGKIQILPGGGVTLDNRQLFLEQLGVCQLHGTRIVF